MIGGAWNTRITAGVWTSSETIIAVQRFAIMDGGNFEKRTLFSGGRKKQVLERITDTNQDLQPGDIGVADLMRSWIVR